MKKLLCRLAAMVALACAPIAIAQQATITKMPVVNSGGSYVEATGVIQVDASGVPLGTAGNPLVTSGGGGGSVPTGAAGSPNAAVVTVQGISGGTNQNVAVQSSVLPTGATTSALQAQISGQIPASLGAKTSAASLSITPATDAALSVTGVYNTTSPSPVAGATVPLQMASTGSLYTYIGQQGLVVAFAGSNADTVGSGSVGLQVNSRSYGFNGSSFDRLGTLQNTLMSAGLGVAATGIVPTSAAAQGIQPATVASASSSVLKATSGNLYSLNVDNSTTAGYVLDYDATTAPAGGATLTASLIRYHYAIAASGSLDKAFPIPVVATNGHVVLCSSSLTTFTAITCALITGQVK